MLQSRTNYGTFYCFRYYYYYYYYNQLISACMISLGEGHHTLRVPDKMPPDKMPPDKNPLGQNATKTKYNGTKYH